MTQKLIQALQNPSLYDHPIERFEVIETHISWILLTGPFAYKIRKAVDFGFLNFTSLEQRLFDCEEELRLNPRTAPDLYVGLVAIYGSAEAPSLQPSAGSIFEYAVKMRQFSQSSLLSEQQQKHLLQDSQIIKLAELIAQFHQQIPSATTDSDFGSPATLWSVMEQNFLEIRPRLAEADDLKQLQQIENWSRHQFQQLKPLLLQRKSAGFVKECHGDLHLDNITIYQDKICPFDCIEFNPKYRWVDSLNDLAFLLMDLEVRGRSDYSRLLLDRYLQINGDYSGLPLMSWFKCYRALVRAKVTLLGDPQLTLESQEIYRRYANLAESYTQTDPPQLLLMHGLSGSGKSWLSSQLLQQYSLIRLRSDVIRKQLFATSGNIYHEEITQKAYIHLAQLSHQLLSTGSSVIVDATFLKRPQRQLFTELAGQLGIPIHLLNCEVSMKLAEQRILDRAQQKNDPSDATYEVMQEQWHSRDPVSPEEQIHKIDVDMERPDLDHIRRELGVKEI